MSEFQRYEFMTVDAPLTRAQLDEVNALSSHIEANSRHATVEYNWGDFKHDPIRVLQNYFDGFLYWANWGSPRLAFRFPAGILPPDLLSGYDFDEFVTLTHDPKFDILDIHFGELAAPDEWTEYELGSLIGIREELMDGDLRALYITWLAMRQPPIEHAYSRFDVDEYDEYEDEDEELEDEDDQQATSNEPNEHKETAIPPIPDGFGKLTSAQQALAELLQVPPELLDAAAHHSKAETPKHDEDIPALIDLLPAARGKHYLLRLAQNEHGLSWQFVRELRELQGGQDTSSSHTGEHVSIDTLLDESRLIKARRTYEEQQRKEAERQQHLQTIYDNWDNYWLKVDQAAQRSTSTGYDEATHLLIDLRDAATQFKISTEFQHRFQVWLGHNSRRPALFRRLREQKFPVPPA